MILQYEIDMGRGAEAGVCADVRQFGLSVVLPVQTHSCNAAVIDSPCTLPDTDALITRTPGLRIGVRTADCVPVLLHAPDIGAVAAIHAGWKGSLGGITGIAMKRLIDMGADPALTLAAFGPCICGHCYEVSPELIESFRAAGFDCCVDGRLLDLEAVNRRRLLDLGLLPQNIKPKLRCTLEVPALPSWRRQATDQRLLTWISRLPL